MSSPEKIAAAHDRLPLNSATVALLTLVLANRANWIYRSLYFQDHTLTDIGIALGLLSSIVIISVSLLRLATGQTTSLKIINILLAMLLTSIAFIWLKSLGSLPVSFGTSYKTVAVALSILAGFLGFQISATTSRRIYPALIVAALVFSVFPWALAHAGASTIYWPSPSYQSPKLPAPTMPPQNSIVLLLDELSASAAGPIVDQLRQSDLQVSETAISTSGKNTINVIPAIWMRANFDQSVTCGLTQLCSGITVLDFARIKASSDDVDIVGFYHRYCSIKGLRSCYFGRIPSIPTHTDMFCDFPGVAALGMLGCEQAQPDRNSFITLRDELQNAMLEAPFWAKGGILYAHLLSPHPLMGIPLKTLSEEYADNIQSSASLVRNVAQKARSRFGNNFRIIIFSDHPLRTEIWCRDKTYVRLTCKPDQLQLSAEVPLIIAGPTVDKYLSAGIGSNSAVFDLLFSQVSRP